MNRNSTALACAKIALGLVLVTAACAPEDHFSPKTESELATQRRVRVRAINLAPATVSLDAGGTRQFTATARLSDGTTVPADVTYQASGGTVTTAGLYTAGQTAGTYRVIATQRGGTLADTSTVTITAPTSPLPPSSGKTFYLADAETGNYYPWTSGGTGWQVVQQNGTVTNSTSRPRHGARAWKYEITSHANATIGHDVRTMSAAPQASMGSPNGRYLSGYYSFWAYVDAGYTAPGWNLLLGWMTGVYGSPSPISNLGLQVWNGTLQLVYTLKNCSVGAYVCPSIPGYTLDSGWYFMTPQSPAGVAPFPRNRWVHVSVYYKMAPTNGRVAVWQDGVKVMDLTAPGMNTFGGSTYDRLSNTAGDMMLQFGIYGGPKSDGVQRLYVDDFKVTDYRPLP